MTNLLEKGAEWLAGQCAAHMATLITYERGGLSAQLAATIGRTEFEQSDEYGLVHRFESRDFLVRTSDFVLAGGLTVPQAGDRIREPVGDVTYVYEVMAPGTEPPYRYSDSFRRMLRIHTKHVGTE